MLFYDMNQKILTKKKKKSYFQNFSWFQFYIYSLLTHDYLIMCIGIAPSTTVLN